MGRPFRAAPERQRGSRIGTEAEEVPAERSGAACPTGAVTAGDWGKTDEGRKTFRAAPERQRGSRIGTEAAQVPAKRSGAACPDGAVTAGDWG